MQVAIKKRGSVSVTINGKPTILHSKFENIALMEQVSGIGIYQLANRFGTGDVRLTDVVNLIWSFSSDRDTAGWTKDEIAEAIIVAGPDDIIAAVQGFMILVFGVDEAEAAAEDAAPKKRAPKPKS